jgi:hypothetical protein
MRADFLDQGIIGIEPGRDPGLSPRFGMRARLGGDPILVGLAFR